MKDAGYIYQCIKKQQDITAEFEYLGQVSLKGYDVKHVIFENCVFNDKFSLSDISNAINIEFLNCTFKEYFQLESIQDTHAVFFKSCTFHKWIQLDNINCIFLDVENCINHHSFTLQNVMIEEVDFLATEASFGGTLLLDSKKQPEVRIASSSTNSYQRIIFENFNKVAVDANVQKLDLLASEFKSLEVYSSKGTNLINSFTIADNHFEGTVLVEDVKVDLLSIQNASCNKGAFTIGHTEIQNCDVQNCQIDNFFLNQITFLNPPELLGSSLKSWRLSGIVWSDRKRSLKDSFLAERIVWFYWLLKNVLGEKYVYDRGDVSLLKDHIETYRQLKAASIANNNQIESLTFYRNEMKLYWKLIRIEGGIPWYDRLLVFVNRWSSDFGQNWLLPLLWLFGLTTLYYVKLDSPEFSWHPIDWWNGFLEMLSYLNPFRKVNEGMTKVEIGIDVLYKVASAYFIYHFVRASRKFGKV